MQTLAVQFLDQGLHRAMFDAMPMPVFVVDSDVSILEYNAAAAELIGREKRKVLRHRGGEVLHCVHSTESAGGCGHAAPCSNCVVRDSVRQAAGGKRVTRRCTDLELVKDGRTITVNVRVSCQPFAYQDLSFVLLMLEGLND